MNFLFDENTSVRLARALKVLGEPVVHVQDVPALGKGTPDELVIEYAARLNYLLVSLDRNIRFKPHLRAVYLEHPIGVYFLKTAKKGTSDRWETVQLVFKHWQAIKADADRRARPFMRLVTKTKIERFH